MLCYHYCSPLMNLTKTKNCLVLIADSCGGQNKNQFTCGFLHEITDPSSQFFLYRRADMKFPVVGHTFLPPDRAFSIIEKYGNGKLICSPHEWEDAICSSFRGNLQHTEYVGQEQFKDWKSVLKTKYSILNKALLQPFAGEKIEFQRVRWLNFGECGERRHPGEMWFKYSLKEEEPWRKIRILKNNGEKRRIYCYCCRPTFINSFVVIFTDPLPAPGPAYNGPIKLDPIKADALHSYIRYMEPKYHYLYPAPDPDELAAAKAAQAAKRAARRNQLDQGADLHNIAMQQVLEVDGDFSV